MKQSLLAIAFVLLASPCFAVLTRTYTICESGGGCDYTTVTAAESAIEQDLVANDSAITFEIQNTWTSAHSNIVFSGWTNDVTRFPTLTAVGAARATATWSTTAFRAIGNRPLELNTCTHMVIDGIQAKVTTSTDHAINTGGNTNITIKNCFLSGDGQTTSRGILINNSPSTSMIIRNNVIIDCTLDGISILAAATNGVIADNNTIENCATGFNTSSGDGVVRNTIFFNTTTPVNGSVGSSPLSEENYTDNGSITYTGCGSCGTGDQVSQSDPFVSLAGENYHLASGATAIDAGKDLSADFTDAIGGKTRDANFDKGADEFISSGPTKIYKKVKLQKVKI